MITTRIIGDNKEPEICKCGNDLFYFSWGKKKRNRKIVENREEWEEKAYYILRCTKCGNRREQVKYDWRKAYYL